jgi:hypothetical protein
VSYPDVLAAFPDFTAAYEGTVYEMYVDCLGLVTCGVGNLIDPVGAALGIAWQRRSDGILASLGEVQAEWQAVKAGKLAWWPKRAPRPLYLSPTTVVQLVQERMASNESWFVKRWANWSQWPADAQLAAHSCAWAAGAGWRAPHFDAAVAKLDFRTCAGPAGDAGRDVTCRGEGWLNDTGNPGLRPRNLANKVLFQNAAVVLADGYPLDKLVWPVALDG